MHVLGIHVAELSIDGIYTIDSYLNHTEGIGPKNLTDFSGRYLISPGRIQFAQFAQQFFRVFHIT